MKKKKKRIAPIQWRTLPKKDWTEWFGEWLVANMVIHAWRQTGKVPSAIGISEDCLKDLPDGDAIISYETK